MTAIQHSAPLSQQAAPARVALTDVSETGLLTLFCRALESRSSEPVLRDLKAEEVAQAMRPLLSESPIPLLRRLARGQVRSTLMVHIALRAQKFDDYVTRFLAQHPDGLVVNLGCGMDSRYHRTDNGQAQYFDVDLPELIALKRSYFSEEERYHLLGYSVFDYQWMERVVEAGQSLPPKAVLFLAEGLFMYLPEDQVKALVLELQKRFPGCELACEVVNKAWVKGAMGKLREFKMQRELKIGKTAGYHFGISSSHEPESWHSGIELLDDWSYFDTRHPKLGILKAFASIEWLRKIQWTVHYRLG